MTMDTTMALDEEKWWYNNDHLDVYMAQGLSSPIAIQKPQLYHRGHVRQGKSPGFATRLVEKSACIGSIYLNTRMLMIVASSPIIDNPLPT